MSKADRKALATMIAALTEDLSRLRGVLGHGLTSTGYGSAPLDRGEPMRHGRHIGA